MILEVLTILFYGIGDLYTTRIITSNPDGKELNPFMAILLKRFGFISLIILKAIIITIVIINYNSILIYVAGFGVCITAWNANQIIQYKKKIKDGIISL